MALQRPQEALTMYQQALQLKPGSRAAKVHSSLAQRYHHLGATCLRTNQGLHLLSRPDVERRPGW